MKRKTCFALFGCIAVGVLLAACGMVFLSNAEENMKILVRINGKEFSAALFPVRASEELAEKFPLKLNMRDFNRNEKYCDLPYHGLTLEKTVPSAIRSGDIMLYGTNTLVIFYENIVSNRYAYTPIGRIENSSELYPVMKDDVVTVRFEK